MTRPRLLTAPGWTKAGCRDLVVQYQGGRPTSARLLGFLCGTQPTGTDVGNAKARGACEALQNKDDRQVASPAMSRATPLEVANLRALDRAR